MHPNTTILQMRTKRPAGAATVLLVAAAAAALLLCSCEHETLREAVDHRAQIEGFAASIPDHVLYILDTDVGPEDVAGADDELLDCVREDRAWCELTAELYRDRNHAPAFVDGLRLNATGRYLTELLLRVDEHALNPERFQVPAIRERVAYLARFGAGNALRDEFVISDEDIDALAEWMISNQPYQSTSADHIAEMMIGARRGPDLPRFGEAWRRAGDEANEARRAAAELELLIAAGTVRYAVVQRFSNPNFYPEEMLIEAGLLREHEDQRVNTIVDGSVSDEDAAGTRSLRISNAELTRRETAFRQARARELFAHIDAEDFGARVEALAPPYPQYRALMAGFAEYRAYADAGGWEEMTTERRLRRGSSGDDVVALRRRLAAENYLSGDLESATFDEELEAALEDYQRRHLLIDSGTLSEPTRVSLNRSVDYRIAEIAVAMQRWRETRIGDDYDDYRIEVNIPDFHAEIWDGDTRVHRFRVVVGRKSRPEARFPTRTPLFSDELERIVLNPFWVVPASITDREILPEAAEDPTYMERNNYELVERPDRIYIRQRPGTGNALGRVKFLFPNPFAVYMHDTPSRRLFDRNLRAYSHGCIRVHEPLELARILLMHDHNWSESRADRYIRRALRRQGEETSVTLNTSIPVHIEYFVARADDEGRINFLSDIYDLNAGRVAEMRENIAWAIDT